MASSQGKRDSTDKGVTICGNISVEEVVAALAKFYPDRIIRASNGEEKDDFNASSNPETIRVSRLESLDSGVTSHATNSRYIFPLM